ncbi:STAS domain-containing protein [Streptomyces sp. NPDC047072]|uniref:STAS domain-containing protein n=1 Tax=Streptomyces sp. NPDC047072 TaxID=3154809 RepID=UPI0033E2A8D1
MALLPSVRDLSARTTLLSLPPEIDVCNARDLFLHVMSVADAREGRLRLLVLDLTGTSFMDSQGVRLVGDIQHRLRPHVQVRVVAGSSGLASRVLEMTGVRRDVPVYDDLGEAVRS